MNAQRYPKSPDEKRVFWQSHIDAYVTEGRSQVAYCRSHGLALATFQYWKRRLSREGAKPGRLRLVALDTSILETPRGESVRHRDEGPAIQIRCGRFSVVVLSGTDGESLRTVLTILGGL
jgi:hypothetical protein